MVGLTLCSQGGQSGRKIFAELLLWIGVLVTLLTEQTVLLCSRSDFRLVGGGSTGLIDRRLR